MAEPELEIITVGDGAPFKVWSHGYPFRTVRWHFHPEYEIHLVTATGGRMFVGDFIGPFAPGNLVFLGANLPHNWVSDIGVNEVVPERCLVLQFNEQFIGTCEALFPAAPFGRLLEEAQRGVAFPPVVAGEVELLMRQMMAADPLARPALLLRILEHLLRCTDRSLLASVGYQSRPLAHLAHPLHHVLNHIARNLAGDLRENELAALCGYTASAFSRIFHRQTGMTFTAYVNGLRINRACRLLTTSDSSITTICFESGFNTLSNFNRRFLAQTRMTPRHYRRQHRANDGAVAASDYG